MYVFDMPDIVSLVSDLMLPEPTLPNSQLALAFVTIG
jgi:hypothetical protein